MSFLFLHRTTIFMAISAVAFIIGHALFGLCVLSRNGELSNAFHQQSPFFFNCIKFINNKVPASIYLSSVSGYRPCCLIMPKLGACMNNFSCETGTMVYRMQFLA